MDKVLRGWVFVIIASILLAGSLATAGGKAKGKGDRPPGWTEGEKEGWKGADFPPALEEKAGQFPPGLGKSTPAGGKSGTKTKGKDVKKR